MYSIIIMAHQLGKLDLIHVHHNYLISRCDSHKFLSLKNPVHGPGQIDIQINKFHILDYTFYSQV